MHKVTLPVSHSPQKKGARFIQLKDLLPIWDQLTASQRRMLTDSAVRHSAPKGTLLHNGSADCVGLFVVLDGVLRVFAQSEGGKEITLYRLLERDICLFSAACILSSVQFDMQVQAETDAHFLVIPAPVYKALMHESLPAANFTNQLMASRFTEVMWLLDQILSKSFDARLAAFLLEEAGLRQSTELLLTHEQIAGHLGTAREVVSRMLKYFESEGAVELFRGGLRLKDAGRLEDWARGRRQPV